MIEMQGTLMKYIRGHNPAKMKKPKLSKRERGRRVKG
jgi:hypothetical protein